MGPLGWQETLVIFVLALLLFGPKKLPELGKTIGKAITEFRRASTELKSTWEREMVNLERETEPLKEVASSIHNDLTDYNSSYSYDGSTYEQSSYESPAEYPSTVSASAPEGAEFTEVVPPEAGVATAEVVAGHEGASEEAVAADVTGESGVVPNPVAVAVVEPASHSPAAAG
jgi:TatA/E family protein of Tat protein translocase